jgi:CRISPR-associated protein Csx14
MSLLAISVASLNFDRHDRIWHLYTPEAVQEQANEGKVMHVSSDAGIKLIQGPFIALGAYIYQPTSSFNMAQEEWHSQMDVQDWAYCAKVVDEATPAQLKVLQAFARGLRPQQVANELHIALVTVNSHKTALLDYCHSAWTIPDEERLDYHFLYAKFASYFHQRRDT